MTRDDILRLVEESGFDLDMFSSTGRDYFERFATLVAEHERERIKTLNAPEIEKANAHIAKLEKALKELDEIYGDSPQAERIIVPALYGREI